MTAHLETLGLTQSTGDTDMLYLTGLKDWALTFDRMFEEHAQFSKPFVAGIQQLVERLRL